jgi:hypothetical protein
VLPEEIDSAGDSDRPKVDPGAFGLGGGRIEPRFAGCGRAGITIMNPDFKSDSFFSTISMVHPKVLKMQRVWAGFVRPRY